MIFTLNNFYQSDEWRRLLELLRLERTGADGVLVCEHCGLPIVKKYDCIGHHKIELTDENVNDYSISLNPANVMLIHHKCHDAIHERFGGFRQSVYLVYGSPCAGKTTWVQSVARVDDLIVDIDHIWECVCLADRLHKPSRLKANVFSLRDCLLDQIKTRLGQWRSAYVIGGYPLRTERDRLCNLLRAEPVFIDTERSVCIERAPTTTWREYVEDWFESYTP